MLMFYVRGQVLDEKLHRRYRSERETDQYPVERVADVGDDFEQPFRL